MFVNALRAGIPLETFLNSTFWELGQMVDASIWRARQDQKLALHQAWHIAALAGATFAGKLPPLKRLLADKPTGKMQSPVQQLATMHAWAALIPGMKES